MLAAVIYQNHCYTTGFHVSWQNRQLAVGDTSHRHTKVYLTGRLSREHEQMSVLWEVNCPRHAVHGLAVAPTEIPQRSSWLGDGALETESDQQVVLQIALRLERMYSRSETS
jgi:hypothetical protein